MRFIKVYVIGIAMSLVTTAYMAELMRGALLAVGPGQTDAALALGLRPLPAFGLVVLPQALRIALPALVNEFINLVKLTSLANTIRQVNGGKGADIITLQEVENDAILEQLRSEKLADLAYQPAILVEGTDTRGIDVAILSKFALADEPQLHPLHLPDFPDRAGDTRGVLQATFVLPDESLLTAFAVHFPAPFHPTGMRIAAYQHLEDLLRALPEDHHAFAAGDFNTTSKEDAELGLLDAYARPNWTLAHDVGCSECKGSYYYGRDASWSFLDMILFAPARGAKTTAQIRGDSVAIANGYPPQVSENATPLRFRSDTGTGVSDHWPLVATIELTKKQ